MAKVIGPKKVATYNEKDVVELILVSNTGVRITFLNYAALIRDWQIPLAKNKGLRSVVCGFDQFEDYPLHSPYFGAIVGRVANRIGGARFVLDGKEYLLPANEGANHLHGGAQGLAKQIWDLELCEETNSGGVVKFCIKSPNGEMGYPGNLSVSVTYTLVGNKLQIELEARTDAPTPVNLVQHNYFNLMSEGEIGNHILWLDASEKVVVREDLIPTGKTASVVGTEFDFQTNSKCLCDTQGKPLSIDNTFVLSTTRESSKPAATLLSSDREVELKLWTDQAGIHVYTGSGLNLPIAGLNKRKYSPFGAICLEDQNFPDAINNPNFPSSILKPGDVYRHVCAIEIASV